VTYHRKRREIRDRQSELLEIPGVGARTRTRLVEHFGSLRAVERAGLDALTAVVPRKLAEIIHAHFRAQDAAAPAALPDASSAPSPTADVTLVTIAVTTDHST
jgi:excinuclease ABC subunit C